MMTAFDDHPSSPWQFPYSIGAAFWMIAVCVFLIGGCGNTPGTIPLDAINQSLMNQPTYSVVLEDMKQEGSISKRYFHKYLVIEPDSSQKTEWLEVPKQYYDEKLEFLGMALATKKEGELDSQVSPPGYGYVGDERYGEWREDSQGGSFWAFYGKYAFFTSLFGGWYHPIYRHDYRGYSKHRSQGRPYFGSSSQFGSSGKIVKQKRPGFYQSRMSGVNAGKRSFSDKVNSSRVGRSKSGFRGRAGGSGK